MKTTYVIEIDTDNSAFNGDDERDHMGNLAGNGYEPDQRDPTPEIARILRVVADRITSDHTTEARLFDLNGNSVGRAYWK